MSHQDPIVHVVDDDASVLQAMERLLRIEGFIVRTWTSARAFIQAHDPKVPGCLLTDLALPDISGLDLLRTLRKCEPERFVIVITGRGDIPTTVQAMKCGAISFLQKPLHRMDVLLAVNEALARDADARASYRERSEIEARLRTLTPREQQVLELVNQGLLNKQIAARLGTAEKTIKVHRGRLMEKMQVKSAANLVALLARNFPAGSPNDRASA